jgi:hypothetical protein
MRIGSNQTLHLAGEACPEEEMRVSKKVFEMLIGLAAIIGALLLFRPAVANADVALGTMRIGLLQGDVQVKIAETGEWVPAANNMPLLEGDELWVPGDGHAAIQTNNGIHIRLSTETAIQVLRTDRDSFQFFVPQGYAYILSLAPRRSVLQVDTPDGSIRVFGRATFRIDIPDGETDIGVFKGSVLAENVSGTTHVHKGSMLAIAEDGFAELSPLPPPDEWQRWNERRDRAVFARGGGYRHLPEELRVYASDYDEYGRWVSVPEYGYVWTPTVAVTADWAPYRHGRWVWRGGDYVWIGYESWGWAPYHYGRWTFVARIGWCWVPPSRGDVYWGPGYVGWVRTGGYVAWVPLAPRETYYGHGHFGRHSMNVTKVNITRVRVTNVYRNINVTNSITVVNHNTFVTGRHESVDRNVLINVKEDFSHRRNIVVGRPPIQPTRETHVPVVRHIPEGKRPPQTVVRINVEEIRQSRPLVRESGKSALRPQAPPRTLEVKKVEKPKAFGERVREHVRPPERRGAPEQVAPARPMGLPERARETRKPPKAPTEQVRPQVAPPEKGKLERAAPPERGRPQERTAPPERERRRDQPPPPERGKPQVAPPEGKPREQAAPPEGGRRREQATPPEQGKPQAPPRERGIQKAAPPEKETPKEKEKAKEKVKPKEAPADNGSGEEPRGERGGGRGRR